MLLTDLALEMKRKKLIQRIPVLFPRNFPTLSKAAFLVPASAGFGGDTVYKSTSSVTGVVGKSQVPPRPLLWKSTILASSFRFEYQGTHTQLDLLEKVLTFVKLTGLSVGYGY